MKPKQLLFLVIVLLTQVSLLISQSSFAQFQISPVPLPVGSGARALGMGGAFIAVADDATATSWNPGGLTQLERPELSVVGSFLSAQQDFDHLPDSIGLTTGITLDNESESRGDLNFTSVAYPFKIFGKNLVAALNYHQIYDFHMDVSFNYKVEDPSIDQTENISHDFVSKGGIGALTPAIAMQVMPRLSIGVAVNFYTDEFFGDYAWKEKTRTFGAGTVFGSPFTESSALDVTFKNFQAVNVTAGMLLDVWEKEEKRLSFGAVYHSPYTADVDRIIDQSATFDGSPVQIEPAHKRSHLEIDYPMSFGAGFGFRYSDALSFSMNVTWTDWSEFQQEDEDGVETRPIAGASEDRDIDDTFAVRFGTEYLIFKQKMIVPVRGGLFYEPRPSLDEPTDVYGVSVGSGITFKRFSIDAAYQFRWANDVDDEDFALPGTFGTFDLTENLFLASVIVYF